MAPVASVIVPVYGTVHLAERAIQSVRRHSPRTVEVVLVDDATPAQHARPLYGLADVAVVNHLNQGYGTSSNRGARVASGDILIMLNSDCEVTDGWFEPLVAALDVAGVAGPKLVYPDGKVQHAGVKVFKDRGVLTAINIGRGSPDDGRHDTPADVDAVTGACLAVHRDVWDLCGGYSDAYRNGYEDVDLCLTVQASGFRVRYEPASLVVHHESASGAERWQYVDRNVTALQNRWGARWPLTASTS